MSFKKFKIIIVIFFLSLTALYAVSPKALNRRGVEMGEKKLYNAAVFEFNKAIKHYDKFSSHVYHNKAFALAKKGRKEEAKKFYEEALRRNPNQILTGENLGYLYYTTMDYENAVRVGEHVLKVDPKNTEVPKWLPDAYRKRIKQRRDKQRKELHKKIKEKDRLEEEKDREREKAEKAGRKGYVELDFMIRTGVYPKADNDYRFIVDPVTYMPMNFLLRLTPLLSWEIDIFGENPYMGSNMPDTVLFHEGITATYKLSKFMLGIGVIFSHYQNNIALNGNLNLWDVKVGFIIGYEKYKWEFRLTAFPRLILYDGPFMNGETYDISIYKFNYKYKVTSLIGIYVLFHVYEYWIFDHPNRISDYWGVYSFGFGITLGQLRKTSSKVNIKFTVEVIERLYYAQNGNTNPYGFLNGQGFFGINAKTFVTGDPFPAFDTFGTLLAFRVDEKVLSNFFIYQKVGLEMGYTQSSHFEINLVIGFGYIF